MIEKKSRRYVSVDIYNLCCAAPDSRAEELYKRTQKCLEDHCESMKTVRRLLFFFLVTNYSL